MKKRIFAALCAAALLCGCSVLKPKIAVVTYGETLEDRAFNQLCMNGLYTVQEADHIFLANPNGKKPKEVMDELESKKPNLVFNIDFEGMDYSIESAKENPNTTYIVIDNIVENPAVNVAGVTFRVSEACYEAGYIAGHTVENGKIGFIGGIDSPLIAEFEYSFRAGADAAAKERGIEIEWMSEYAGSFYDKTAGERIAKEFYEDGCRMIFTAAGTTGLGAIEFSKGTDLLIVGVDYDQSGLAPDNVLTSVIKRVDSVIASLSQSYIDGEKLGGRNYNYGMAENAVGVVKDSSLIPSGVLEKAEALEKKISKGEIVIPVTKEEYEKLK